MATKHTWQRSKALGYCVLCCFFLSVCAPAQPELPYEEKIVIRGLLDAGQLISDIQISRTIPALEEFSYEKIFIGDAKATITVDGQIYPMELQPRNSTSPSVPYRSLYRAPNVRVVNGKTYKLEVRWKNLIAQAQTFVPLPPQVDSVNALASIVRIPNGATAVLDTVFESIAFLRSRPNEVYRIGTTLHDAASGRLLSARGFGDASYFPSAISVALPSNTWRLTTATLQILTNQMKTRVTIEAYDGAYYQYYQTRSRSGQIGLFSPGGPNIDWNVTGDGIGEFVGMTSIQRPATVRLK